MTICNFDLLILILIMIFIIFIYDQIKSSYSNKETFDNQIDNDAIQKLSKFANDLTTGGLTVPGNLIVSNKLATNGLDPNNMPDGWGGGLRIFDGYSSGGWAWGNDGKEKKAEINKYGDARFDGSVKIGSLNTPQIIFGKSANNISSTITDSIWDSNSMCIVGQDNPAGGRKITMWDNVEIRNNLNVNGYIKGMGSVGAYLVDGGGGVYPIFASTKNYHFYGMNDKDDAYILLPGYKILLYTSGGYGNDGNENNGNPVNQFDNSNGFTPLFCNLSHHVNTTGSCRLYYLGKEVIINGIS